MKRKIPGLRRVTVWFCAVILADSPSFSHAVLARPSDAEEVKRIWDFSDGVQGWVYDDSWAGDGYHGTGACEPGPEREMLTVSLDYSADVEKGWSQTGISFTEESGIDYSPYKVLTFDLYYDLNAYTTGQIAVKAFLDNVFQDQQYQRRKISGGFHRCSGYQDGSILYRIRICCKWGSVRLYGFCAAGGSGCGPFCCGTVPVSESSGRIGRHALWAYGGHGAESGRRGHR